MIPLKTDGVSRAWRSPADTIDRCCRSLYAFGDLVDGWAKERSPVAKTLYGRASQNG